MQKRKTREPTLEEIDELVSFLPKFCVDGFTPIKNWNGGRHEMPYPEYHEVVEEFFRKASKDCWTDFGYNPVEAEKMIENSDFIKSADINNIKTMLTLCVRGERFCPGHWGKMIEGGYIQRLLERLIELKQK